ncbi:MAG: PAS domain S-box protein, partial [Deltaproteobacteria bacterium]|nr:PAS domain S-box protein [Deltaproteobacteria bacterium]
FIINDSGEKYLIGLSEIKLSKGEKGYGFGGTFESIDHKKGSTGESWYVICYRQMSVVLAPVTESIKSIVLTGTAIIFILVLVSQLFVRKIAKPIAILDKATEKIGKGDFKHRIDMRRKDEFGNLAHSFNNMSSKLQQTTTSLERLRKNQVQYRLLADNVSDVIWTMGMDQRFTYFSPSIQKLRGHTPEEALQIPLENTLTPESYEKAAQVLMEEIDNEGKPGVSPNRSRAFEIEEIRKDGSTVWTEVTVSFIRDEGGLPSGIIGISRDITERKQTEDALRRSKFLLAESQAIAHVGSWSLELVDNRLTWSDEVYRIFGLEPQEFEATYEAFLGAIHPEDRTAVDSAYSDSIREGSDNYEIEHRLRQNTGEVRHVLEKCVHIRNEAGVIIRSIGMVQDITKHKLAEKELEKYAKTQEVLVQEVNHRVKNNISAIIGMLYKEQDRAEAGGKKPNADIFSALIGRIEGLSTAHSLLSQSGWQPMLLSKLCEQVITSVIQNVAFDKNISVEVKDSPISVGSNNAHHLALVLNELSMNTFKHALAKRDRVSICVDILTDNNNIHIVYRDDGSGYPGEMIQGDFSHMSVGFNIIQGIVKKNLQGDVLLENDNGAVTTIIFSSEHGENMEEI